MEDQVPDNVKIARADIIKAISKKKYNDFVQSNLGKISEVLIEKHRDKHNGNLKGITRNYLTVQIKSEKEDLYNTLQMVRIKSYENGIIAGELV
jgi:tRNA A37 methylthiotransferase MiaB